VTRPVLVVPATAKPVATNGKTQAVALVISVGPAGYSPSVPTRRRNFAVVLGTLVAVGAVVAGATAATGGQSPLDQSAAGQTGRSISPAAAPGPDEAPDEAQAPAGLFAEVPAPPDAARDAALATKTGTLVAQGADVIVESVALAAPTTVEVDGVSREVSAVYRVTISAGPYVMRDMPAIISVDAKPIGMAAESVDLSRLVLFTYDDVIVTDGATVALSYGLPTAASIDWSTTLEVVK
jgi:hypothetical protein